MNKSAVLVEKEEVEKILCLLKMGSIYDSSRRVVMRKDGWIELPILMDIKGIKNKRLIVQETPQMRVKKLRDFLISRGWSEEEIKMAPRSWDRIGDIAVVKFSQGFKEEKEIGNILIEFQGVKTVLAQRGIRGTHRKPIVEVIAGEEDTITMHKEGNAKYLLDLSEVMFSPGNTREREKMGRIVKKGECVLDMFAGIGYFSIPMAISGAVVTAIEENSESMRWLEENIKLNGVEKYVFPVFKDCREFISGWLEEGGELFDRVVMGHYDSIDFIEYAYFVVKSGGVIHVHEVRSENDPTQSYRELILIAENLKIDIEIIGQRYVKGYSPGTLHLVTDIRKK
jgi:tRNA wybutosine-synthesizing protein 2